MNILLPVYQYPTMTVLIDDSQSFLKSLAFHLNAQRTCKIFHDTQHAIDWLNKAQRQFAELDQAIRVSYDEQNLSFERRSVTLDLGQIYRRVMNPKRFLVPSVLVVDYAMPQMNGLEFCEAVKNLPCKKILFVGQADEKIAVAGFNQGLIDRFIKKGDADALDRLEAEISALQKEFFLEQSQTLKDLLIRHSFTFLSDLAMGTLVAGVCHRYGFVEFYLFPNPTGILFVDAKGKSTLMVVETEASLMAQFEAAQDHAAPPELLSALRELRVVPFFHDSGGMYSEAIADEWQSYCLPARVCAGRQDYFWALFDLPSDCLPDPIYSYSEFLQGQTADHPS